MPRKYKTKRRTTAKSSYGYQGYASGQAKVRKVKLRYTDIISITNTTGAVAENIYRCNSPFDPNYTTGSAQPMGFDQWALLYNHYTVISSKIHVKAISYGSSSGGVACALFVTDDVTPPYSAIDYYIEAAKGPYSIIPDSGSPNVTLTSKFSTRNFFNIKDVKDNTDNIGSLCTNNPAEQAYWMLVQQPMDKASTVTRRYMVTIEYNVLFSEPKDLSPST